MRKKENVRFLVKYLQENGDVWEFKYDEYYQKEKTPTFDPDVSISKLLTDDLISKIDENTYKVTSRFLIIVENFLKK